MRSPEHALAFQSAFTGILYTPKLPINRTSGHYVINVSTNLDINPYRLDNMNMISHGPEGLDFSEAFVLIARSHSL